MAAAWAVCENAPGLAGKGIRLHLSCSHMKEISNGLPKADFVLVFTVTAFFQFSAA